MDEFVEHAECLDQQLLEQVFGFWLRARKPPRQPVKAIEMRSHHALEDLGLVWVRHRTLSCYSCRKAAGPMKANTLILTAAAMVAFAANSVLCRLALGAGLIDAASFATVRTVAGAVMLGAILLLRRKAVTAKPDWRSVVTLYLYMVFFAFAYLSLSALRSGEHFSAISWAGLILAIAGLVYLVSPGLAAPDPLGATLMTVAGISWGVYSLVGRSAADPTEATAHNFLYAVPLVIVTSLVFVGDFEVTAAGAGYAVASGAVASGIGYAIWYTALKGLTGTGAATVQLSVPVIAAIGGVLLLSEAVTLRLVVASAATLGGVALVLTQRNRSR
jgi:drug/metabolite transporter (DMT)-like permease